MYLLLYNVYQAINYKLIILLITLSKIIIDACKNYSPEFFWNKETCIFSNIRNPRELNIYTLIILVFFAMVFANSAPCQKMQSTFQLNCQQKSYCTI